MCFNLEMILVDFVPRCCFYVLTGLFVLCSAEYDKYSEDPEFKPATRHSKDIFEEVRIQAVILK